MLPRADSHELASPGAAGVPAVSSLELARRTDGNRIVVDGAGPPGEVTTLLCGAFFFDDTDHPAIAGFPHCIHVPGQQGHAPAWLAGLTAALATETQHGGPGSEIVMARISDALITRALRHHLETADEPGWLRGLQDPFVSTALAALHADLSAPWTVGSLAQAAGLSRAAFAARFTRTVGRPPMDYVVHSRIRKAMTLLRAEHGTVRKVAAQVGYGSEAALSAAFLRHTGTTPGAYRRSTQPVPSAPAP